MVRSRVTLIASWLVFDGNEVLLCVVYAAALLPPPELYMRPEVKGLRLEPVGLGSQYVPMGCSFTSLVAPFL